MRGASGETCRVPPFSACQRCQRPLAAKGTPYDEAAPISPKDPLTLMVQRQLGKRRPDKSALLAPAGSGLVACTRSREGSFAVWDCGNWANAAGTKGRYRHPQVAGLSPAPEAGKDPSPLLVQRHQGKRRRDKRALSAPAGSGLVACTKKPEGSFDVNGAALVYRHRRGPLHAENRILAGRRFAVPR